MRNGILAKLQGEWTGAGVGTARHRGRLKS